MSAERQPALPFRSRCAAGRRWLSLAGACILLLAACGGAPPRPAAGTAGGAAPRSADDVRGREIALYALGLLDTGYRFGGKNPEAGLDCSGMVSYIYAQAAGLRLAGSAADLARGGRGIRREALRPGDLVFFDTLGRADTPYSHVGIYIGDDRFVHAPSSTRGRVRIDRLDQRYFATRFVGARTYFD